MRWAFVALLRIKNSSRALRQNYPKILTKTSIPWQFPLSNSSQKNPPKKILPKNPQKKSSQKIMKNSQKIPKNSKKFPNNFSNNLKVSNSLHRTWRLKTLSGLFVCLFDNLYKSCKTNHIWTLVSMPKQKFKSWTCSNLDIDLY